MIKSTAPLYFLPYCSTHCLVSIQHKNSYVSKTSKKSNPRQNSSAAVRPPPSKQPCLQRELITVYFTWHIHAICTTKPTRAVLYHREARHYISLSHRYPQTKKAGMVGSTIGIVVRTYNCTHRDSRCLLCIEECGTHWQSPQDPSNINAGWRSVQVSNTSISRCQRAGLPLLLQLQVARYKPFAFASLHQNSHQP